MVGKALDTAANKVLSGAQKPSEAGGTSRKVSEEEGSVLARSTVDKQQTVTLQPLAESEQAEELKVDATIKSKHEDNVGQVQAKSAAKQGAMLAVEEHNSQNKKRTPAPAPQQNQASESIAAKPGSMEIKIIFNEVIFLFFWP